MKTSKKVLKKKSKLKFRKNQILRDINTGRIYYVRSANQKEIAIWSKEIMPFKRYMLQAASHLDQKGIFVQHADGVEQNYAIA